MKTNQLKLVESAVRKIRRRILRENDSAFDLLRSYIHTALWSSSDDDDVPLDMNYDFRDVDAKSIKESESDLRSFINKLKSAGLLDLYLEEYSYDQLGYDFWLTRNHHGTGFWDRSYSNTAPNGTELGDAITKIAESFKEVDMYVGDDGKIYIS